MQLRASGYTLNKLIDLLAPVESKPDQSVNTIDIRV